MGAVRMSTRVGFVTLEEYQSVPGRHPGEHEQCEAERHAGQGRPAVVVVAISSETLGDAVWGACSECFAAMDLTLESGRADWHLTTGGQP